MASSHNDISMFEERLNIYQDRIGYPPFNIFLYRGRKGTASLVGVDGRDGRSNAVGLPYRRGNPGVYEVMVLVST